MEKQNTFFRKTLETIPEETKVFVRRQRALLKRIKYLMELKGLSQKQLAFKMGKRESEVSKWFNGNHNLTLKSLSKLEAALGASLLIVPESPVIKTEKWRKVGNLNRFTVAVNNVPVNVDEAKFKQVEIEEEQPITPPKSAIA